MLPSIWGKPAWIFLHLVTMGYPHTPTDEDKYRYYVFFDSIKYVLPCEKCRYHMKSHLIKYPLTPHVLSSKKTLMKWCIDLHNIVNYYTGKPMLSYEQSMQQILKFANPDKVQNNSIYYLFVIILVAIIMYLIYAHLKKN